MTTSFQSQDESWLRNRKQGVMRVVAKVFSPSHVAAATWPWDLSCRLITTYTGSLNADRYEVSISMQLIASYSVCSMLGKQISALEFMKTERWAMKNEKQIIDEIVKISGCRRNLVCNCLLNWETGRQITDYFNKRKLAQIDWQWNHSDGGNRNVFFISKSCMWRTC